MKREPFLILLILSLGWTKSCDERFPGHTKPPAINHSNPGNQPKTTTCRKDANDQFNLCRCFDQSEAEVMEAQKERTALFCCQCPETLDEAYAEFKDIVLGAGNKFSLDHATDIVIQRCPKLSVTSMQKVERLVIENANSNSEIVFHSRFNLPNLRILSITGHSKPSKYDQDIGTSVTMAEGVLGSQSNKAELILKNTKINKFPKQLILQSLNIDTSLFSKTDDIFPNINSTNIEKLEITNSDILSIFKLGISSYTKPFTFSNNKIHSTCQTTRDRQKCFLQPHIDSTYESNKIQCSCSSQDGDECTSKDEAITKFECNEQILRNTFCSDLQENVISLEYLKDNKVNKSCSPINQFEYDLEVLNLVPLPDDEDPMLPSSTFPVWVPIVLGIFAIGIIIVSIFLIIKLKNQPLARKGSIYKPVKEDFAIEGIPVEDED